MHTLQRELFLPISSVELFLPPNFCLCQSLSLFLVQDFCSGLQLITVGMNLSIKEDIGLLLHILANPYHFRIIWVRRLNDNPPLFIKVVMQLPHSWLLCLHHLLPLSQFFFSLLLSDLFVRFQFGIHIFQTGHAVS